MTTVEVFTRPGTFTAARYLARPTVPGSWHGKEFGARMIPRVTEAIAATAIDPVRGMAVDLATATLTLEHNGTLYAFCAPVCRKVFSDELG